MTRPKTLSQNALSGPAPIIPRPNAQNQKVIL